MFYDKSKLWKHARPAFREIECDSYMNDVAADVTDGSIASKFWKWDAAASDSSRESFSDTSRGTPTYVTTHMFRAGNTWWERANAVALHCSERRDVQMIELLRNGSFHITRQIAIKSRGGCSNFARVPVCLRACVRACTRTFRDFSAGKRSLTRYRQNRSSLRGTLLSA